MQLFGIGPLELLFILVIAVVVLGPKGIVTAAREAGKVVRKIIRSPFWREMVDASNEIRDLPRKIVREAGIEDDLAQLRDSARGTMREINQFPNPDIKPVSDFAQKNTDSENSQVNEKEKTG